MSSKRFIICKASAGSGKTYTLVRQFIEISISAPTQLKTRYERILAITFTNPAANEMKQRLMSTLGEIIAGGMADLVAEMALDMAIDPASRTEPDIASESEMAEIRRRCKVVRSAILHHYSNLSVCTIDSFVLRLVKTFAYDLNLPLNFNVMVDQRDLLQTVVDNLMSLVGMEQEEALTQMLTSFIEQRMEEGQKYDVESAINKRSEELLKEGADPYLEALSDVKMSHFLALEKRYRAENLAFEQALKEAAQKPIQAAAEAGLSVEDFPGKTRGFYPYFERLSCGILTSITPSDTATKVLDSGVLYAKTASQHQIQQIESITPTFLDAYARIKELLGTPYRQYLTRTLILRNLYEIGLLSKLRQLMDEYYRENESVHISEFNKSIADVVDHDQTPFVYERIGSRYSNYLIDEFQDTSKLQWLNFLPLIDEALSQRDKFDTAPQGAQSLVVGDAKQAIYRFRQGDVRQFIMLPQVEHPFHGKTLAYNAEEVSLDTNRRTKEQVVTFNNNLFRWMIDNCYQDNDMLVNVYRGLEQKSIKPGGFVQVSFCPDDDLREEVRRIVRHQVDDLGYDYGDIYVLANKRRALVEVSDYFSWQANESHEEPIPVISAESLLLSGSTVVLLLRTLLGCLHDATDRAQAARALTLLSQIRGEDIAVAQKWLWRYKESNYDFSRTLKNIGIDFIPGHFLALSLYDCCEELVRLFALEGKDVAYVATLLNAVASFSQSGRVTLGDLLEYLDDNMDKLSCTTSDELNAVQLMTVHKSKGLESPIIIYLLPNKGSTSDDVWVNIGDKTTNAYDLPAALMTPSSKSESEFSKEFKEELAMREMDSLNRFYVAMTRPREKLFVVASDATKRVQDEMLVHLRQYVNTLTADSDSLSYSSGEDSAKQKPIASEGTDRPGAECIDNISFPQWGNRITIAGGSEAVLTGLALDSRRYGIVVHDLLAHIANPDEVGSVVNDYCQKHHIEESDAQSILERIERMMSVPENRRYFDSRNKVRNEASLLYHGEVLRPDRIIFAEGETWVVDFKTGVYDAHTHEKYLQQINTYADAIAEMGYPNVKPFLVYL